MSIQTGVKRWRQTLVTKHYTRPFTRNHPSPAKQIRSAVRIGLTAAALSMSFQTAHAGSWTRLHNGAPGGVALMELLSDGTVIGQNGGGTQWFKLTPDIHGSYVNGTWSTIAPMNDSRLYGSTAVLPDGRVFYAGGEYGTGGNTAETYDPIANLWTRTPDARQHFSDSVSTVLPNGNIMVGPVGPRVSGGTAIYDYLSNTWSAGPTYVRGYYQDEASWVKLPDESILTIDPFGQDSERFIPSLNVWVNDGFVPIPMYDSALGEIGPGVLLPTGKAFYIGDTGHTALYTPSGNANPGAWAQGPDLPNDLGAPDAPAAMMINGVVLCAVGPKGTYNGPTTFCEYNPYTNAFTTIDGPGGSSNPTQNAPPYTMRMLDLPDGSVLFSDGGSQLHEYRPSGVQIASARPTVTTITQNADGTYRLTGTLLTGISEGGEYGDDVQMASNYPIVRLTAGNGNVYYERSSHWSTTSVMQSGSQSTQFSLTRAAPSGSYMLQVVTNGIASDPVPFQVYAVSSVALTPTSVVAGSSSTGTVTISSPAPVGGLIVHLSSDTTSATVPATVTIPMGATSADFPVSTASRPTGASATITASVNGFSQNAALTILASSSLTVSPTQVNAGDTATGTVRVSAPAPTGGLNVYLSSSAAAVGVPTTPVLLPAGQQVVTFPITTLPGHAVSSAVITAIVGDAILTAKMSVTIKMELIGLTVAPTTIAPGGVATGTVTLSTPPTTGTWITLSSSDAYAAPVYIGVTVRAGDTTATFPIKTRAGVTPRSATITATYHGVSKTATLAIGAPQR